MSANQEILQPAVTGTCACGEVVRWQIESVFEGGLVAGIADRQLLERFTAGSDAAGEAGSPRW